MAGKTEPRVACQMLTADRQQQTDRAVRSFLSQDYRNKELLILDTGREEYFLPPSAYDQGVTILRIVRDEKDKLGALRNLANEAARDADLICHMDSDDWRHPASVRELVGGLPEDFACIGYSQVLFWETQPGRAYMWKSNMHEGHVLGGSILYRRDEWRRRAFPIASDREEADWLRETKTIAMRVIHNHDPRPRMVCERHPGNVSKIDLGFQCEHASDAWRRATEWDSYCERAMAT